MELTPRAQLVDRIEAGIDWLSCTLPLDALGAERWYAQAQHVILAIGREGYEVNERSLLGFDGISAGNNFVGCNQERVYLQISSHHADEFIRTVDRDDLHYSRIDVQNTVWFTEEQTDIAKEVFDVLSHNNEHIQRSRVRSFRIIIGSDGGDTVYIGSTTSEQQARIYNKARQTEKEHYQNAWRYEICLRDRNAGSFMRNWRAEIDDPVRCCLGYVHTWLLTRCIPLDYFRDHPVVAIPKQRSAPTEVDSKLRWLKRQVAPSIEFLTERGYRDSVLEALGL